MTDASRPNYAYSYFECSLAPNSPQAEPIGLATTAQKIANSEQSSHARNPKKFFGQAHGFGFFVSIEKDAKRNTATVYF